MTESLNAAILLALALIVSTLGMAWLALAKPAHWIQVRGTEPMPATTRHALRALGTAALVGSLVLCLLADDATIAVLVWIMSLAAAALCIAFALAWRSRWLAWTVAWFGASRTPL